MKHQIDTMTSINNLVKDYENTIGMLRIQNEQLRLDLEELRTSYFSVVNELAAKKRKKREKEKGML
jgi:hypothetical protein